MVCLSFVYRPKENVSRTDITDDDQKAYAFAPTYLDGSTNFHRHIISGVVFFYSNKIQSVFVDYAITDMGCFDDYSDAAPHSKKNEGNGITNFLLHVAQCIIFNQTKKLQQHLLTRLGWIHYNQV